MRYEGVFEVPSGRKEVYAFLTDPSKVTTIFPDVEGLVVIDENNFTLKAKVGMSFIRGTLNVKMKVLEKNAPSHAWFKAVGTGVSSTVDLEAAFDIEERAGVGSKVKWTADAKISGLMASIGSRVIDAAAAKYVQSIVGSLKEKLS